MVSGQGPTSGVSQQLQLIVPGTTMVFHHTKVRYRDFRREQCPSPQKGVCGRGDLKFCVVFHFPVA